MLCSTPRRSPKFRHQPCVHAMVYDPGGADRLLTADAAFAIRRIARPPRNKKSNGARSLHARCITACTLPVYASQSVSRQPTQDSVP
jgi:hypothetical protein